MSVDMVTADGVALITINRPERRNAMDIGMRRQLGDHIEAAAADEAVRAVVLTGAGGSFCAGADLGQFGSEGPASSRRRMKQGGHRIARGLWQLEKPVIAAVSGPAIGLGWSLALACDLVIAGSGARFGMTFGKVGLVADTGAAYFLARHIGVMRAKALLLESRMVTAGEAMALGLVNEVVEDSAVLANARTRAAALAAGPTFALGMMKRMLGWAIAPSLDDFLDMEALVSPQLRYTEDYAEGTAAFREKRPPKFTGR